LDELRDRKRSCCVETSSMQASQRTIHHGRRIERRSRWLSAQLRHA
jgi:hypothetical protein